MIVVRRWSTPSCPKHVGIMNVPAASRIKAAVALVRQLWRMIDSDRRHDTQGRIPALDQVRLRSTGELRVSDDHSPSGPEVQTVESIAALGTMLASLLSPGREWGTNPAQLRSIVRRAMRCLSGRPPGGST